MLLAPDLYAASQRRYSRLRRERKMGPLVAFSVLGLVGLAHVFFPLEGEAWQRWHLRSKPWFAHLDQKPYQFGDPLRYLLQAVWVIGALLLLRLDGHETSRPRAYQWVIRQARTLRVVALRLVRRASARMQRVVEHHVRGTERTRRPPPLAAVLAILALAFVSFALVITQPLTPWAQTLFVVLLFAVALIIRRIPGRFAILVLIVLSLVASGRYIWWRYTATLYWNTPQDAIFGLTLLVAETYSWLVLVLGYMQTAWPLRRTLQPLPPTPSAWPTVDVFIPTYNEDLGVVKPTVYAAVGLDWPADKLRIHLLDDGNRPEVKEFARRAGVNYTARTDRKHAKAGNLNHSLQETSGELIAVFDCDHVPSQTFLKMTVGEFLVDPKLALVQTPHHFFSPDPFERNLDHFGKQPNENTLFYGLIQDGNDLWNAAFFCGSCAVLRRSALEDIGGFAVETVTEDAHTALRLHRRGYRSAYLRIPLAAGLATENLAAHIGQRIRWARGMIQIFRTDNPLLGPGLSLAQRLCYLNAMLHFLAGIPRLIYLTAPLAFLVAHAYIIYAPALMVVLFVLPHMVHANVANSRMQGAYRRTFWGEIYETVLSWYIARPTTVALFWPSKGAFNVTAKGGLIEQPYFDWKMATPYVVLALANVGGLGFGVWRLSTGPSAEVGTVALTMLWTLYNLVLLGGAIAVAAETTQLRRSHRVPSSMEAGVRTRDGRFFPAVLTDFSSGGVGVRLHRPQQFQPREPVFVRLVQNGKVFSFPAHISSCEEAQVGIGLDLSTPRQQVEFLRCTFGRGDTWIQSQNRYLSDQPLKSGLGVARIGLSGYWRMLTSLPSLFLRLVNGPHYLMKWLWSFVPHTPFPHKNRA
ncbi:MAG TPA: UDP-forming cellulose synthase catalytic subunit [Pusillimonas sp.]|uniref:UDP-forming cellulose synthase catalytic subunit n=1 Tax=Pusillimonas sp. TaxID=3040095 RepID=UPI002B60BED3|nr:UDP-forming cellulose synthase catalytic subunit [Pusillimonas sp.]HUH88661.1 UDP-forming cellulose synthase catalytic subunit [Pusillimonas sp.]